MGPRGRLARRPNARRLNDPSPRAPGRPVASPSLRGSPRRPQVLPRSACDRPVHVANLLLLDGCTVFYSDENGDLRSDYPEGYFFADVRHLSQWRLLIDGHPLKSLTSRAVDYYSGKVVAAPEGKDPPLTVERDRFVTDGVHEDILVRNHSAEERLLELDICFEADFADIMEAQEPGAYGERTEIDVNGRSVTLIFEQDGFRRGTRISFSRKGDLREDRMVFKVEIGAHSTWDLCV